MPIETNLNTSPYFDDHDEDKSFHRILFRPRTAVQARELTQLQTILQTQIERFGNWAFRSGDIVYGCGISDLPKVGFARLADTQSNGAVYNYTDLVNTVVVSASTNLSARVIYAKLGVTTSYPNTSAVYFDYINTGTGGETSFSNNEQLDFKHIPVTGNPVVDIVASVNTYSNSTAGQNSVGFAHGIKLDTGVVFLNGNFVKVVSPLYGIVQDWDVYAANNVVGFLLQESIVTESQDPSLFDNSLGYSNENAPGAHRLKLLPSLVAYDPVTAANTPGFNPIASYNFGALVSKEASVNLYSYVDQAIATRIYEEAGNYVVNPFIVDTITYNSSVGAGTTPNAELIYARVNPGIGYAEGHRVELLKTAYINMRRGTDTRTSLDQQVTFNYGNYVTVDECVGVFPFDQCQQVKLYDAPQNAVTNGTFGDIPTPAGNNIGTALCRQFTYLTGQPGTNNALYNIHLFNYQMVNGFNTSSIRSIVYNPGAGANGYADVFQNYSAIPGSGAMLFGLGVGAIKNLKDQNLNNNAEYQYRKHANTSLNPDGTISVSINQSAAGGIDMLPYGGNLPLALTDIQAQDFIFVLTQDGATTNLTGTVQVFNNSGNVVGTTTTFVSDYVVGDMIQVGSDVRTVATITNNTFMICRTAFGAPASGQNYKKYYKAGQIIPITSTLPGSRQITMTSVTPPTFVAQTGQRPSSTLNCTVFFNVLRTGVNPAAKEVRKNRMVLIDTTSNPSGPWCLGFSDIHHVKGIFGAATAEYGVTGANVMGNYVFDTGQRDTYYGLGYLRLSHGATSSNFPYLTVIVDYFKANTTSGVGFYTAESYPIDDVNVDAANTITTKEIPLYIDTQGNKRPLRNYLDFRPVINCTANDTGYVDISNSTQVTAAITASTTNPANTFQFTIPALGLNVPAFSKNFETDYTYYLPRKDLVYMTPTTQLKVKEGLSQNFPQTPLYPENGMALAVINVPPYPSLTTDEVDALAADNNGCINLIRDTSLTVSSSSVTNRRYTMRDIGVLDNRISDLEYYASLTLLQQKATDLTVTDSFGLDRFKNGIFVDPFSDFTFSDVSNPEYTIAIDQRIGVARPRVRRENIDMAYNAGLSSNVQITGRCLTLAYANVVFLQQPYATEYRQGAPAAYAWWGFARLIPSYDMHIDIYNTASINVNVDIATPWHEFANTPFGSMWGAWTTTTHVSTNTVTTTTPRPPPPPPPDDHGDSCNIRPRPCPDDLDDHLCTDWTNHDRDWPTDHYTCGDRSYEWEGGSFSGYIPRDGCSYYYWDSSRYRGY